ncbi:LacI family DNA-binding transcriptional regulator [Hoeflea sp. CAU 1731]
MFRKKNAVSIRDVAKAAKVSPPTVSNALSGKRYVSPELAKRIRLIAHELGYNPDPRAASLRTGKVNSIALLSPVTSAIPAGRGRLEFLMEIAEAAATRALEKDLALVIVPPTGAPSRIIPNLLVDGVIAVEPANDDQNLDALVKRSIPIVSIGRFVASGYDIPYVDMHYYEMTMKSLDHLRQVGARKIAVILCTAQRQLYSEMHRAYADFCAVNSMQIICHWAEESDAEEGGTVAVETLFSDHSDIDGLLAPLATFAVGARKALRTLGRNVPEDVKIVTRYNGIRSRECDPPLTAIDLHLDEVAKIAVDMLLSHMSDNQLERKVKVPEPTLIVRRSTEVGLS